MRKQLVCAFLAIALCGIAPAAASLEQSAAELPPVTKLTEVEIRLSFLGGGGGCVGRCLKYNVVIRGAGTVEYEDVGQEPRDPRQRRVIPVDDVVALVNEFLRVRFLDAADRYGHAPAAVREGDALRFGYPGSVDGGEWDLTLRIGAVVKTVHLRYPTMPDDLRRLRDLVDNIGGPKAWTAK
jgi:hypothetical protein